MSLSWYFNSNIPIIFAGVILAIVAGGRADVGFDYLAYQNVFNAVQSGVDIFLIERFEIGYLLLNWFAVSLGISFNMFLMVYSLITMGLLVLFLCQLKRPHVASLALLYYTARFYLTRDFGQIRASLSVIICLFAIRAIIANRIWRFVFLIIIASLFQRVALVLIPTYLLYVILRRHVTIVTYSFLITLAFVFSKFFSGVLQSHAALFGEYSAYLLDTGVVTVPAVNPVILLQLLIGFMSVMYFFRLAPRIKKVGIDEGSGLSLEYTQSISIFYMIGTLVLILLSSIPIAAGRTSTALNTLEILIVPLLFIRIFRGNTVLYMFTGFTMIIAYFFFNHAGIQIFIPYHFYFF
ncbi:EpsG family protein [Lactiplantibacillus daoliensis]|uniref:EpsG family protein n=1 Tax=Lactiplantibacillus daoliensis TaxID=2559916 RepID=A0ABW1UHQ0_9LACO